MLCPPARTFAPLLLACVALAANCGCQPSSGDGSIELLDVELLNVSYDPTRELWRDLNEEFRKQYERESGKSVVVKQSHGGSGSQARAVIDGLEADVVTLALWPDTNAVHEKGLISAGWEERFPNQASPYYSLIVFVVRKGNPKGIRDWPDLVQPGVEIITPTPKTSGNGKLSFLAAWGHVTRSGGSEDDARAFVEKLYRQVPVLDAAARAATVTFAQKGIGDVHLTWESEARLEVEESGGALEIVYPPRSIQANPPVAVVDANVDRRGTREVATAYLNFAYTPAGQALIAKHHFRPIDADVLAQHREQFPDVELFTITDVAPGWKEANHKFFAEGGVFDQIFSPPQP